MIALSQFNSLSKDEAVGLLAFAWRSRPRARRW